MSEYMSRAEHLAWAKARALLYCDAGDDGDDAQAFTSLASDLGKHPETRDHIGLGLGASMLFGGMSLPGGMRVFIEGFN